MKKTGGIIVTVILLLIAGVVGYFYFFYGTQDLSPDQQELVDSFGYPEMFTITYLPVGEGDDVMLVRHETWTYQEHQQVITIIGGDIANVEEIEAETGDITYSSLHPEDFEFSMGYDEVVTAVGSDIEAVDMFDELYDEGEIETYVTNHAFFTIEHGHLTYFETIGLELGEEELDE